MVMEGEEKCGGGRLNRVEIVVDSDDDEPIGSLLKLKRPKNAKKVKGGEVKGEKIVVGDAGLGGMEDTLASFKKKLKVQKKDSGSFDVSVSEDAGKKGCIEGDGGIGVGGLESRRPGKARKVMFDVKREVKDEDGMFGSGNDNGHVVVGGTLDSFLVGGKDENLNNGEGSGQIFGGKLEDSSSDVLQKVQPSHRRKSCMGSQSKEKFTAQTLEDGVTPSAAARQTGSASTSIVARKDEKGEGSSEEVSGLNAYGFAQGPIKSQRSMDPSTSNKVYNDTCSYLDQKHILENRKVENVLNHLTIRKRTPRICGNEPCKTENDETLELESESSLDISQKSVSMNADAAATCGNGLDFGQCQSGSSALQPYWSKVGKTASGDTDFHSIGGDPNMIETSNEVHESEFACQVNYIENCFGSCVYPNECSASVKRCSSFPYGKKLDDDEATGGNYVPSHDSASINEEADGTSHSSMIPEVNGSCHEDAAYVHDSGTQDGKISAVQRASRKARKRRHEDMAYEGDEDWEILINEQFLESEQAVDSGRSYRTKNKLDFSSISVSEAENGGPVAVSVGLKAWAVGPVEKIKFKEVLKRKGGLQEYLECRNKILGLWGKDFSRLLPLADCGVTDTPSEDEMPRTSLIREIYTFLDQSGYINFGIASDKAKALSNAEHDYASLEGKSFSKNQMLLAAHLEDGASFDIDQAKIFQASPQSANGVAIADENIPSKFLKGIEVLTPITSELSGIMGHEECTAEKNSTTNVIIHEEASLVDRGDHSSNVIMDDRTFPALSPELRQVHFSSCNVKGASHHLQHDSSVGKKILVIGAGPAGLTAARHLQRHGFSVTVIEARDRIGGRVFTDCSSLSVPVDLGASIITGVEADAATERRPDPSSLICAQLGLELTVLNSDCPLYDIVTGKKVPTDLDAYLEEEFNSLLDDMVLLVAQKGECAMKMSLEDGLEYALVRRRMERLGTDVRSKWNSTMELERDSKTSEVDFGTNVTGFSKDILSPLERRVMDWHYAHLEYGCAALLKEVSLPYWNQDDAYGGFGGAHCMIKGGYSNVVESLREGLLIHLDHIVTEISYGSKDGADENRNSVKVTTSNGSEFLGDAVLVTVPLGCLKAETIKFSPPLPHWKRSSIQRLGFGVLNKVVLEFREVFWDDSVDYFGATAEENDQRGHCFMFWNVRKTVGAPVLIALVVGKAATDRQPFSPSDHIGHALQVLRKLFGEASVPEPVASIVTDWGKDPFSYGAYSYVAIGSSGEDYDILGRPVDNCVFFAGEATCKEHPDTVGGAMMSGLREAVRMMNILNTGIDCTAEVEAMEAADRHSESERDEVRDITKRLEAVDLSNTLYKSSLEGERILTREGILQDMFYTTKTTAGRLHLAKKLLNLPVETLKSFAGTKKGLSNLNSWILDSLGKNATQLLRHCVRLLVLVSTNLFAVRSSGIGKTIKEKVCVHTSRDIRAIASQLVNVWLQVFRREKALNGRLKLSRQGTNIDSLRKKSFDSLASGRPPLHNHHGHLESKRSLQAHEPTGSSSPSSANMKEVNDKLIRVVTTEGVDITKVNESVGLSQEEQAAFAAAEAACSAARAAKEAYALLEAKRSALLQLPKIPSFHKFARREQYAQMDVYDCRKKCSGGVLGRQDCLSEIDSRNCRVREWSVDFSAACANLDSTRISADNLSQRSHSNEIASHMNFREQSGESAAADSTLFTKAWIDTAGSEGIKDHHAIERWQSQAAAVDFGFVHPGTHMMDEGDSNMSSKILKNKNDCRVNESSISQVTINKESHRIHARGADRIKQAVVDFVASLLMPVYKARKIDREGYKSIMKKCATKVMEQATDAEKAMAVPEFLDYKRKNKIRAFVDKLIDRHMAMKPATIP